MLRFFSSGHSALRSTQGIGGAVRDPRLCISGSTFDVSAGGLCGCGSTPQPQTLIVFAPMIPASMPSPSNTLSAGPCRAAASGSERWIMFPGREGYRQRKVVLKLWPPRRTSTTQTRAQARIAWQT